LKLLIFAGLSARRCQSWIVYRHIVSNLVFTFSIVIVVVVIYIVN